MVFLVGEIVGSAYRAGSHHSALRRRHFLRRKNYPVAELLRERGKNCRAVMNSGDIWSPGGAIDYLILPMERLGMLSNRTWQQPDNPMLQAE